MNQEVLPLYPAPAPEPGSVKAAEDGDLEDANMTPDIDPELAAAIDRACAGWRLGRCLLCDTMTEYHEPHGIKGRGGVCPGVPRELAKGDTP